MRQSANEILNQIKKTLEVPFMPCSMLNKSSLVTETITTVLTNTVKMSLVLSIAAMIVMTIFIESVK